MSPADPQRRWLIAAGILGAAAVILGAFGAHALAERVPQARLAVYETGVRYLLVHALAVLVAAVLPPHVTRWAAPCWIAGCVLFSGSLILLVLADARWLGMVAPVGGLLLIAGWLALAIAAWRR